MCEDSGSGSYNYDPAVVKIVEDKKGQIFSRTYICPRDRSVSEVWLQIITVEDSYSMSSLTPGGHSSALHTEPTNPFLPPL